MKKIKLIGMLFLMFLPMAAMANSGGFTASVKEEGGTGLILVAIVFLFILFMALMAIPFGYMFAQKHMKNLIENDRDKLAGAKTTGAGIIGALAGILIVYFFYGTIGSYLDPSNSAGSVDFDKGNAYIFSHYIGGLLDKALGLAN